MRTKSDNARLWEGLQKGTLQVISTDHCPFFYNGKKAISYEGEKIAIPGKELGKNDFTKIPNGLPGVGDRLSIMWTFGVQTGKLSPNKFVELNCTKPGKNIWSVSKKGCPKSRI